MKPLKLIKYSIYVILTTVTFVIFKRIFRGTIFFHSHTFPILLSCSLTWYIFLQMSFLYSFWTKKSKYCDFIRDWGDACGAWVLEVLLLVLCVSKIWEKLPPYPKNYALPVHFVWELEIYIHKRIEATTSIIATALKNIITILLT